MGGACFAFLSISALDTGQWWLGFRSVCHERIKTSLNCTVLLLCAKVCRTGEAGYGANRVSYFANKKHSYHNNKGVFYYTVPRFLHYFV